MFHMASEFGICRSSHRRCSVKKGVVRNFATFTGQHLCQSLFFNKVAGLRPTTLLKNRLWHRSFPVNSGKFWRTPFLQNTSERLLPSLGPAQVQLRSITWLTYFQVFIPVPSNELLSFSNSFLEKRGSVEYKRSCNFLGTTIWYKREKN